MEMTATMMAMVVVTCHTAAKLLTQPCWSMRSALIRLQAAHTAMATPTCSCTVMTGPDGAPLASTELKLRAAATTLAKPQAKLASPAALPTKLKVPHT